MTFNDLIAEEYYTDTSKGNTHTRRQIAFAILFNKFEWNNFYSKHRI